MINLLMKLTGGRPMTFLEHAFIDKITGIRVNYYVDYFGRRWMAENKWAIFRVPVVRNTSFERRWHDTH